MQAAQVQKTSYARKYGVAPQNRDRGNLFWPFGKSGNLQVNLILNVLIID